MLLRYQDYEPELAGPCFIAPGAHLIGQVRLGVDVSVWFNAVLRAEAAAIVIGDGTNLQDGVVVHTDRARPCEIGCRVTVGHRAIVHGARIEDDVLIGMGAIVMNGAHIGSHCLIGAGALVPEDREIPAGSLVMGVPGRVVRTLSREEQDAIPRSAARYIALWQQSGWQF